ncbi:hypothetical protein VTK56DRAFT_9807 [Thermocarpiscus australiensis]
MSLTVPVRRARHNLPVAQYGDDEISTTTSNSVAWIVAAVVGGIIVTGTALTLFVLCCTKRRQCKRAQKLDPYLDRGESSGRNRMRAVGLYREEEKRRRDLIRKSLASQSTNSVESGFSATLAEVDREAMEIERRESTRLKEDWKRWEARVRQERLMSGGQHPATATANGVPILSIPSPAKHRSQRQTPLMSLPLPSIPPVLPPHDPGRCLPN